MVIHRINYIVYYITIRSVIDKILSLNRHLKETVNNKLLYSMLCVFFVFNLY